LVLVSVVNFHSQRCIATVDVNVATHEVLSTS